MLNVSNEEEFIAEFEKLSAKSSKRFVWLVVITLIVSATSATALSYFWPVLGDDLALLNGIMVAILCVAVYMVIYHRDLNRYANMYPKYRMLLRYRRN